jgi:hypothetical protein
MSIPTNIVIKVSNANNVPVVLKIDDKTFNVRLP